MVRPALVLLVLAVSSGLLAAPATVLARSHSPPRGSTGEPAGQRLYGSACSACHAPDGRGAAPSTVGFATPLPDFTDCSFATREPDEDWLAVSHDGGPARAFDPMMPAFGEALTEHELRQVLAYVRGFCRSRDWPRGELNLPRALVTEKAYPEDEVVLTTTAAAEGAGAVGATLLYERRLGARSQVELAVPYGFQKRATGEWAGDVGDIAVAFKRAVYHSLARGRIVSVSGEVVLPTGSRDEGFGKGTTVFEPFVTFGQVLPRDAFVQAQVGLELPTNTARAGREAFWRAVFGRSFTQGRFGRTWSPMIEVLAARELASGETATWDLLPQVQVTLSTRQHVMANAGVRIPVSDAGPRRTQLLVYLLWDWFDGGFFEGW
jgi:mono/diheme cytochrome c family protein